MRIALVGASGNIGSKVLAEALSRGHQVTGIVRNPDKIAPRKGLVSVRGDVHDQEGLAKLLRGHQAVISAIHFSATDAPKLIAAVKQSGVKRYLVVGGAGSLEVKPGLALVDTPDFPALYKAEAQAGAEFLKLLRTENELDWTFLSPSAVIAPGPRTGKFRLGGDQLLVGADGKSFISHDDYAIAMIDELETPKHIRKRFTVGY
jgi:putative NADH-flavin reductase